MCYYRFGFCHLIGVGKKGDRFDIDPQYPPLAIQDSSPLPFELEPPLVLHLRLAQIGLMLYSLNLHQA